MKSPQFEKRSIRSPQSEERSMRIPQSEESEYSQSMERLPRTPQSEERPTRNSQSEERPLRVPQSEERSMRGPQSQEGFKAPKIACLIKPSFKETSTLTSQKKRKTHSQSLVSSPIPHLVNQSRVLFQLTFAEVCHNMCYKGRNEWTG